MTIQHDWDRAENRTGGAQAVDPPWAGSGDSGGMSLRKRACDIVLALLLLMPLSFVMLIVAAVLLISEGRPILYVAPRMRGPNRSFNLLKFRTMLRAESDSGATGAHKDWRITRVGRFLRRTRIDELPQLFNILRGDMSFVGPRPPLREFVERFPVQYAQVLKSRPGVTGLATMIYHAHEDRIMAGCATSEATQQAYYRRCLPTKLRIDMIYQRRAGLRVDLWIMMNTVMTVILPNWQGRRPCRRSEETRPLPKKAGQKAVSNSASKSGSSVALKAAPHSVVVPSLARKAAGSKERSPKR